MIEILCEISVQNWQLLNEWVQNIIFSFATPNASFLFPKFVIRTPNYSNMHCYKNCNPRRPNFIRKTKKNILYTSLWTAELNRPTTSTQRSACVSQSFPVEWSIIYLKGRFLNISSRLSWEKLFYHLNVFNTCSDFLLQTIVTIIIIILIIVVKKHSTLFDDVYHDVCLVGNS